MPILSIYQAPRLYTDWPLTCQLLVQQTSTGSRTAAAMLAVEYKYGNKLRRLQPSWSIRVTLGLRSFPALLMPNVAAAPPPSTCSTVLLSSKTHEPNTASGSPLYISNGSFMLRVLWSRSSCTRWSSTLLRLSSDQPPKPPHAQPNEYSTFLTSSSDTSIRVLVLMSRQN